MTRLTLWEIAGNPDDIVVTSGGPDKETGLFVGWITRGEGHEYKPLISTNALFKTAELAKHFMQKIVEFANDFTDADFEPEALANPEHPLHFLTLNKEELNTIQDVVAAAKGGK